MKQTNKQIKNLKVLLQMWEFETLIDLFSVVNICHLTNCIGYFTHNINTLLSVSVFLLRLRKHLLNNSGGIICFYIQNKHI